MSILNRVMSSVRARGLTGTFRYAMYLWRERRWERTLGIETRRFVNTKRSMGRDDAENYEATDFQLIEQVMEQLRIRPDQDVLLDVGCGKGRVVAISAMYPFLRVIGMELDPKLVEQATQNLARLESKRQARSVVIECADAAKWTVPQDVTVVFLFNPFYDETFAAMIARLRESFTANPRDLTIIYLQPILHRDQLADQDWLEFKEELRTEARIDLRLRLYGVNPALISART